MQPNKLTGNGGSERVVFRPLNRKRAPVPVYLISSMAVGIGTRATVSAHVVEEISLSYLLVDILTMP